MPKITLVEPQKKNLHRFNIFLDGHFAFGADEDLVVERRLVVGKEILPDELEKLLIKAEIGKLIERMYRLFNVRSRSEQEVRRYLKNLSFKRKVKGQEEISQYIIDTAVAKMKQKGLLNDEEFAKTWIESRSRKKGPRVLKQELYQKGIDREIIEEVISDKGEVVSQEETASQLLEKKMKVWKNFPVMEFRKKAYEFLMRRGFEYEIVKGVIDKIIKLR